MEFKDKVKKILEIFEIQEVEELPCKLYGIVENHETKTYNKYRKILNMIDTQIQYITSKNQLKYLKSISRTLYSIDIDQK